MSAPKSPERKPSQMNTIAKMLFCMILVFGIGVVALIALDIAYKMHEHGCY